MENNQDLAPKLTPPGARESFREKAKKRAEMGQEIEFPGNTNNELRLPSAYGTISMGAVEILKLKRKDVSEGPIAVLRQDDFTQNTEKVRTYQFSLLAVNEKGQLVHVDYNKDGERQEVVDLGPWQPRTNTPEELGLYSLEDLPLKIDTEKVANNFLTGFDNDTYQPPVIVAKAESVRIDESELPGDEYMEEDSNAEKEIKADRQAA